MGIFVAILQRGSIAISDLTALDLQHLCPGYVMSGWCRGQQTGTMGLVSLNGSTGVLNINWNGSATPADTSVQGINIFGVLGNWQPH